MCIGHPSHEIQMAIPDQARHRRNIGIGAAAQFDEVCVVARLRWAVGSQGV